MPFLFGMPMLVMCGMWQVMQNESKLLSEAARTRR
jgi:hypothetical protein